jgi:hypothetical protein
MSEPMSPERLAEITARAAAATPGHWQANEPVGIVTGRSGPIAVFGGCDQDHIDAEFIAHSREDVPALLVEIERLRSEHETEVRAWRTDSEAHYTVLGDECAKNRQLQLEIRRLREALRVACDQIAGLEASVGELAARPTRAAVLREAADEGPRWASCFTEDVTMNSFRAHLRRMADEAGGSR